MSIITEVKGKWDKKKNIKRIEIYNFNDKEGLSKFKEMTSQDNFLSEVFDDPSKNMNVKTKQFIKRFGYCLSKCFRKTRIKQTKRNKVLEALYTQRRILRTKTDNASIEALGIVDKKLSDMCVKEHLELINKACEGLSCETGGLNAGKLWQLKKKLRGIVNEPPSAMLDEYGNLVTTSKALEELTLIMYKERLKSLQIKEELKVYKMQRDKLCEKQLKYIHSSEKLELF